MDSKATAFVNNSSVSGLICWGSKVQALVTYYQLVHFEMIQLIFYRCRLWHQTFGNCGVLGSQAVSTKTRDYQGVTTTLVIKCCLDKSTKLAGNLTVGWDQACELIKLALNPKKKPKPSEQVKKDWALLVKGVICVPLVLLTHIQTAVRLLPAQSIRLKRRKHDTGMK